MFIHKILNNDPNKVQEEAYLIILDRNNIIFMANNGNDTKQKRYITRRVHFVRSGEKLKMHNIDWCEGGLKLADIATNNARNN